MNHRFRENLLVMFTILFATLFLNPYSSWANESTVINSMVLDSNPYVGQSQLITGNASSKNKVLYKFWILDLSKGQWQMVRNWSVNPNYTWQSQKPGLYRVQMQVRDQYSPYVEDKISKYVDVKPVPPARLGKITMVPNPYVGQNHDIIGVATSINDVLYRFLVLDYSKGQWQTVQNWSKVSKYTWKPQKPGLYRVQVQVKDQYSQKAVDNKISEYINVRPVPPATIVSMSLNSTLSLGQAISVKGTATSMNEVLYRFWILDYSTGRWQIVQNWSEKATLAWKPLKIGRYRIQMQVKDKFSLNSVDDSYSKYLMVNSVLAGKTIVLDAGHGGSDPGAVRNGIQEKTPNIQLTKRIYDKLTALGAKVLLTRPLNQDIYLSLEQRGQFANQQNADLLISIHHDSSVDSSQKGISFHYSSYKPGVDQQGVYIIYNGKSYPWISEDRELRGFYYYDNGIKKFVSYTGNATAYDNITPSAAAIGSSNLAKILSTAFTNLNIYNNRGIKDHNLYMTRWTNMPSVLIEAGFVSNPDDARKITNSVVQEKVAQTIVNSIKTYFSK